MIYVLFISAFIIIVLQHLFFWKSYKKPIARNGDFRIYAHRGYTGEAPDNTKESIDAAIKKGYGWVEIDIVSTKDNVVVCSHNFDLEKETDGLGYIYNHNYDSLKCVNIRSYNNSKNYKIPKLVDVLNLYGHKINYNIEIKVKNIFDLTTAKNLSGLLKNCPDLRPVISSFSPLAVIYFKIFRKNLKTAFIIDNPKNLWLLNIIHPDFLHVRVDLITEQLIKYSQEHNLPIVIWTVDNYLVQKSCERLPVFGIITDL